jgi:hypothetical protein
VILHESVDPVHGAIGEDWAGCDPLDTNSVGAKSINCTDAAGNVSQVRYNVIYNFAAWRAPVDNAPALNIANSARRSASSGQISDVWGAGDRSDASGGDGREPILRPGDDQ